MMDARGGRVLRIRLIEFCRHVANHRPQLLVVAHRQQVGYGSVPSLSAYRTWNKAIERVTWVGDGTRLHLGFACRALAVVVLYADEAHQLPDYGRVVGGDIPYGDAEFFFKALDFQAAIWRTHTGGAIRTTEDYVLHCEEGFGMVLDSNCVTLLATMLRRSWECLMRLMAECLTHLRNVCSSVVARSSSCCLRSSVRR